jgi:hypothetical protein
MGRIVIIKVGADEHAPQVTREIPDPDRPGRQKMVGEDKREHPAIVTHVWPEGGDTPAINVIVFVDGRGPETRREIEHVSKAQPKHHAWDWPRREE